MASEHIVATRRAKAIERLTQAKNHLAEALGIADAAAPFFARDIDLQQIERTENVASFLETVLEKMPDVSVAALCEKLCNVLRPHVAERGQSESAEEVLKRIIGERDEMQARIKSEAERTEEAEVQVRAQMQALDEQLAKRTEELAALKSSTQSAAPSATAAPSTAVSEAVAKSQTEPAMPDKAAPSK